VSFGNVDEDLQSEVLIALKNNTLMVYTPNGGLKRQVFLGTVSEYGIPYSMLVEDINSDGFNETIIGFGGHRVTKNYPWDEYFNRENKSIGRYSKILSRTIRNEGSIRAYGRNFTLLWELKTPVSVQDITAFDVDDDGLMEVSVALGAYTQEDYWVLSGTLPGGGENWTLTEYSSLNGSVFVLSSDGGLRWSHTFNSSFGDLRVRSIASAYSSAKAMPVVVAGVNDGQFKLFNASNGRLRNNYTLGAGVVELNMGNLESRLDNDVLVAGSNNFLHLVNSYNNTVWKTRFFNQVTSTDILDLDADEINDIFVANRDGYVYVLNSDGSHKWKFFIGGPVYHVSVLDLDLNELPEILIQSHGNITLLEFRREYFIRVRGDGFYERALRAFDSGDYIMSRILLDKSENLYARIGLTGLTNIANLRRRIEQEFTTDLKIRADYLYQKSLEAYGLNNYNESLSLLSEAKSIFTELNDEKGVEKVDSLLNKISDEVRKITEIKADGLYTKALSYFGFHDYNLSEQNAKSALDLFDVLGSDPGMRKCKSLLAEVADARYNNAKRIYVGLEFDRALAEAEEAERLFLELKDEGGVEKTRKLISDIRSASFRKESSFFDRISGFMPYVILALIGFLLFSIYSKRKVASTDAEEIAESIEEEMGLIPSDDDNERPF